MSSRMKQMEAARHARLDAEAAERRRAARSRAGLRLAIVAALAGLLVAGAVIVGQRSQPASDPAPAPSRLFAGIPQDGITLGSPKAPAVLTEFADLQCPFCAEYARGVLPSVVDRYVRTGRLRLQLHVLSFLGEDSVRAGAMAAAATRQDRLWPFVDAFYRNQGRENSGYATDDFLRRIGGATAGLDVERALADRLSPKAHADLARADRAAHTLGANSTPAFFLTRGDGPARSVKPTALTPDAFATALDSALRAR
jgi:protein-disulfide isomerase